MAKRKTKEKVPRGPQLELADALCVAFVNTASARDKNRQQGAQNYEELVVWGQQAGLLSTLEAERLERLAAERPAEAHAVYSRAAELRVALWRVFLAARREQELPADDLDALSEAIADAMPALRLVPGEAGLTVGWGGDEDALDRVLWPALYSALELLTSASDLALVRQCGAKGCTLFFLDRSKSRKRRWCDPKICGRRARALRYYYRTGKAKREDKFRGIGYWTRSKPRKKTSG